MIRLRWIPAAATCWAFAAAITVGGALAADPGPSPAGMEAMVSRLTAPEFAGRGSGTAAGLAAADTVAAWLRAVGLDPAFDGSWIQEFGLSGEGWAGQTLDGSVGRNVGGILRGAGDLADRYLVIGAHHDHLGRVEAAPAGAPLPRPDEYYPGANDNASGVAVLLDAVRRIRALGATAGDSRRSLLVVAFGAEEVGLQGSGYLVSHLPVPAERIDLMINLDTVGRMEDNRLYVSGVGTAARLPELVERANTIPLELSLARGGWSGSDHMSFNTREIPVLFLFGGPYEQYNTPADRTGTLDYAGMARISDYLVQLAGQARRAPAPFEWILVATKETDTGEQIDQDKRSWFGSLPDFTEEVAGYKLAGVFDDSPAARAGLLKGDVLIRLGGRDVTDLASFTRALRAHSPGDLVEVTVLRDGKRLNFTVVLGDRADRG